MSDKNKITLKKLLNKYFLIIPDYQRDYAQGRDNPRDSKVLDMFVETIIETLKNKDNKLSFDYVYGNIKTENDIKVFYPVDGQQRLTTLFLFYIYLYQNEKDKDFLYRFRYLVHPDTNDFIKLLIENGAHEPEFLIKKDNSEWNRWFEGMSSIPLNPCAQILLNAYRKIEFKLKGIDNKSYIENLENITFQFLDTKENKLPDSAFWKMNARGRQLTDSEIFKAETIKYIFDNGKKKEFADSFSDFYSKIFDDLEENLIRADKCIMRLIKSFCQWQTSESEFEFMDYIASSEYRKVFTQNDDFFIALPRFFKFYCSHNVKVLLPKRVLPNEKQYLFEGLSERIISAMIIFFRSISPDVFDVEEKFRYWMRLSSNLIDNSQSISALKLVLNTLCDDKHIASIEEASVFDNIKCDEKDIMLTEQLKEEHLKAVILSYESRNKWRKHIENAENNEILSGKISILLPDGVNTTIGSFESNLEYLEKLWQGQKTSYTLTRILLGYYEYDKPQVEINMRCPDAKAAKNVIYKSLAGCFHRAVADDNKLNPAELDLNNKPYWIESLCRDGKLLIDLVPNNGNVYTYYGNLVVLRNGKRIDTYGNIIFDKREIFIANLIKDGRIKCLYEQQIMDNKKPTHYFKDTSVRFIYKAHFFELYYYPFGGANDVYLLKDDLNTTETYCKKSVNPEEVTDDSQIYYCFRFGKNPTQESITNSMDKLIEEGLRDHVIKQEFSI